MTEWAGTLAPDPGWALHMGCPAPFADEGFVAYCQRLGLYEDEIDHMLEGLVPRTAVLANQRLAHQLALRMPRQWDEYVMLREVYGDPSDPRGTLSPFWAWD